MKGFQRGFFLCVFLFAAFLLEAEESHRILDIIAKKRDRQELSKGEIDYFVQGFTKGNIPDYQASAFLMAVCINGMSDVETAFLTDSMTHSGRILSFAELGERIVDKHSTGGVGDKTSLIIVPICSALGLKVPKMSGRGLGHTGGTLDKLESIPGLSVYVDIDDYMQLVKEVGSCIVGQSKDVAPADKKIYALRDVSGSVESAPLIASSILSKKLAEGIDVLVMDVKTGSGAFIKEFDASLKLGEIMKDIGKNLGKQVVVVVSDMNQPLGMCVGNALEVKESVDILKGHCLKGQEDLRELSFTLATEMLIAGGKAQAEAEARALINGVIQDGSAFEKFKEIAQAQGGNPEALEDFSLLPTAKQRVVLKAPRSGYVHTLDAWKIAKACSILGSGRKTIESTVDLSVGTIIYKKMGDFVEAGEPLLEIHYNSEEALSEALSFFEEAYVIEDALAEKPVLIKRVLR